jgi:site-specific DNA recombinase
MDAVGYIRVSTAEQARGEISLEAQDARIRAYCAAAGLTLRDIYRDEGVSTERPLARREGGAALVRALARREASHVILVRLDRAFRSTIDCLSTVQVWDQTGISLHLVDHGGQSINTASAVGRMFLTMLAGFAEMEKRLIGERTAAALRQKKARHQPYSPTPYGFDRVGDALTPNPTEQAIVHQVQGWRQQGRSLCWIAARLTRRGVPTKRGGRWHACTVRYVLNNGLYGREVA